MASPARAQGCETSSHPHCHPPFQRYLWHQSRIAFRDKWLTKVEKYVEMDL